MAGSRPRHTPANPEKANKRTMQDIQERYEKLMASKAELERKLSDPDVVKDQHKYAELNRTHSELEGLCEGFEQVISLQDNLSQARQLIDDADEDMAEMARMEIEETTANLEKAETKLELLLLPRDPNDAKNTIIEIRAGTGGDEAALFAGDLLRMYTRYVEILGWKIELISSHESDLGGFKEVIFSVIGDGAYSRLKFEGGTHRVQRVPQTETQGRIHTSAVTVAVMPEAEEVEVSIKAEEIKIDVFRSSGPGGQSVNTTDSAVRITHLPTGLVVSCQDEKSQLKNKNKAMKVLRARLLDKVQQEQHSEQSAQRKAQVGSGDRSGRIRTYNFPQNRLSDHRINLTLYSLEQVLEGELNQVIDPLIIADQAERLRQSLDE